jgi:hypothetical protein
MPKSLDDFLTHEHSDDHASRYEEERAALLEFQQQEVEFPSEEPDWDDFEEHRIYRDAELPW